MHRQLWGQRKRGISGWLLWLTDSRCQSWPRRGSRNWYSSIRRRRWAWGPGRMWGTFCHCPRKSAAGQDDGCPARWAQTRRRRPAAKWRRWWWQPRVVSPSGRICKRGRGTGVERSKACINLRQRKRKYTRHACCSCYSSPAAPGVSLFVLLPLRWAAKDSPTHTRSRSSHTRQKFRLKFGVLKPLFN